MASATSSARDQPTGGLASLERSSFGGGIGGAVEQSADPWRVGRARVDAVDPDAFVEVVGRHGQRQREHGALAGAVERSGGQAGGGGDRAGVDDGRADDRRRCGSAARMTRTIPSTLTSNTLRHSSIGFSSTVPCAPMPALLITTSMPPMTVAADATASATDPSSDTSARDAVARRRGAPDGSRSSTATLAPRASAAVATA